MTNPTANASAGAAIAREILDALGVVPGSPAAATCPPARLADVIASMVAQGSICLGNVQGELTPRSAAIAAAGCLAEAASIARQDSVTGAQRAEPLLVAAHEWRELAQAISVNRPMQTDDKDGEDQ